MSQMHNQAIVVHYALSSYNSATSKYSQSGEGSTTANQNLSKTQANTLLEDQLRLAEDNYNDMKTLISVQASIKTTFTVGLD